MSGGGGGTSTTTTTCHPSGSSSSSSTYEATMARQSTVRQPDRIHWDRTVAFRDSPYRQLHHQKGLVGLFAIRLLEAADLERSYWSALALGPVKLLGLSTAHGPVSSYCTFSLDHETPYCDNHNNLLRMAQQSSPLSIDGDGKMPAKKKNNDENKNNTAAQQQQQQRVVSPVIPQDNHPVWSDFQFELPLRKGGGSGDDDEDGMRIFLTVRVDEDAHVAEKIIPGLPKGDDRLLGRGRVDVTSLCLGETIFGQKTPQVGVLDAWIPIFCDHDNKDDNFDNGGTVAAAASASAACHSTKTEDLLATKKNAASTRNKKQVGRVRVWVSYRPNGLTPQQHDIVALESFARRGRRSTCTPILPPLLPMAVRDVRDRYLLVEYQLPISISTCSTNNNSNRRNNNNNDGNNHNNNKACMRIHRNAVFVIERKNLVDATIGLALVPADALMRTPLGQTGAQILGPALNAGQQVLMPALLSLQLVFLALKTTTFAGWTGITAAGGAIWNEGASAWTHRQNE